ncbi:MAG: glycosyltransferase family A protein [Thermoleophilia bacterium]
MPRFSIVVPAYNAGVTLGGTLDAILEQRFGDWECIVVDDGSTDETRKVADSFAARDTRLWVMTQKNCGTGGAYNAGVRASCGDLIVVCSADDLLLPQHLATMAAFIAREPDYDIYSSNGYYWWPDIGCELVYARESDRETLSWRLADAIRACFYSVGAVYRRGMFDRVGGYREDRHGEDYEFWLRAMALGARHRYASAALSLHRVTSTQKTANLEAAYRDAAKTVQDFGAAHALSSAEVAAVGDRMCECETALAKLERDPSGARLRRRECLGGEPPMPPPVLASGVAAEMAMERDAKRLHALVLRVVGPRLSGPTLNAVHRVSWVVRPLRLRCARGRSMKERG